MKRCGTADHRTAPRTPAPGVAWVSLDERASGWAWKSRPVQPWLMRLRWYGFSPQRADHRQRRRRRHTHMGGAAASTGFDLGAAGGLARGVYPTCQMPRELKAEKLALQDIAYMTQ